MEQKTAKNSSYNKIRSAIAVDAETLDLYLWVIDAPESLQGILQVSAQFRKLSQYIKSICSLECVSEFIPQEQIDTCRLVADAITSSWRTIEKLYPPADITHSKKEPFHGLFTKKFLYTCLGMSFLQGADLRRHLLLEAYLVVASGILRHRRERHCEPREYESKLDESCRLARKLLLSPKADTHNNLPLQLPTNRGDYLKAIERSGELLECIHMLLDYALSGKRAPTYIRAGTTRETRITRHTLNDAVDPALTGKTDTIEMLQPTATSACRLDAPEATSGSDYYQTSLPKEKEEGVSSRQHTLNKRHYLASIAMHNQRLPLRWEVLSLYEISCFLDVVAQLAGETCSYWVCKKKNGISQLELAAVAATVFLRSISLEALSTLKISDAGYKQINPPGYRYFENRTGCWVAKPPKLPMDMTLGDNFYLSAERMREFYLLRSGTRLEEILDDYIKSVVKKDPQKAEAVELFLAHPARYERALQKIIDQLNEQRKTRITLKRIELFMHAYLSKAEGADLTTAMLLTGRDDFLGMPPLHYTAIPVKKLQKLYFAHCRELMLNVTNEMASQGNAPNRYLTLSETEYPDVWQGMAGTFYRPRRKTVRRMIGRLQKRMSEIYHMKPNVYKLLLMHNNIMRYTAVLFAFSTGFRAVRSPLLPPSQIDDATGFAVISDKDGIDYYNARIVWLPPICIQQYRIYLEHLACMLPRLEHLDINAFNALRHLLEDPRPSDKTPLFFFLRMDGRTTTLRPLDIWKEIRQRVRYDLPSNASRHYLRSNLMESGCPPEMIAAFMGHWERGEEPWGKYSALSPLQYAETIAAHLVPLLDEDGWKPMYGMQKYWP